MDQGRSWNWDLSRKGQMRLWYDQPTTYGGGGTRRKSLRACGGLGRPMPKDRITNGEGGVCARNGPCLAAAGQVAGKHVDGVRVCRVQVRHEKRTAEGMSIEGMRTIHKRRVGCGALSYLRAELDKPAQCNTCKRDCRTSFLKRCVDRTRWIV